MEVFQNAKKVRLRNHLNKYLYAYENEESVILLKNHKVSSPNARWTVEINNNKIRLKSCYGKYLTAHFRSNCLMGMSRMTILKVVQAEASGSYHLDESWVEWEPVEEDQLVKLRTRYGNFLRVKGGIFPLPDSVTHDVSPQNVNKKSTLWYVEVVEK